DAFGQMSQVTGTPSGTVTFAYDGFGRRVSKTVGSSMTYFLYDGDSLIGEFDGNGNLTKSYTWGEDGLISDSHRGTSQFFRFDDEGDPRDILTSSGQISSSAEFAAYNANMGPLLAANAAANAKYGGYTDAETGLVYNGGGYYAPAMGMWTQPGYPGFSQG